MKKHNTRKLNKAIVCALSASIVLGSVGITPMFASAAANTEAEAVSFGEVPGSRIPTVDHDQYMVFFKDQSGRMCDEHRCKLGETGVTPAEWIVINIQSEKNGWGQKVVDHIIGWRSTLDGKIYAVDAIPAVSAPVSYYAVFESDLKGSTDDVVTDETEETTPSEETKETEETNTDETDVIDETEETEETEEPEDPTPGETDETVEFGEVPGSKVPTADQNQIMVFFKNENGQMIDEHRCKYGETGVKPAEWITVNSLHDKNGWGQQVTDQLVGWRSTLDGKVYTADNIPAVTAPVSYYATFESTLEHPYVPTTPIKPNDPVNPGDDKDPVTPGEDEEPVVKIEYNETDDCWQDSWYYIHTENIAPLLIGEWGGFMDGGDNEKYLEIFSEFIAKNGLSHTFWAINANSGDTGGLLKDDWKTWDMEKYNMMKKTLWTDEGNGLFIGLDHEVPLGKNGETVTDYYN